MNPAAPSGHNQSHQQVDGSTGGFLLSTMPSPVDKYYEEVKKSNPDYSEEQAWATAWSIFCKHKAPGSPHCKKPTSEYLKGKSAGIIVRVASRSLQARESPYLLCDLSGEPGGEKLYWPIVPPFEIRDPEGSDRYGFTHKVEYASPSEGPHVTAEFTAVGDGDKGGHWSMLIYGKRETGTWKRPDDIPGVMHKGLFEAQKMKDKVKHTLEGLCGTQWVLSYDDVELVYEFKSPVKLGDFVEPATATVTFFMPAAVVLEQGSQTEDFRVFYSTGDWDKGKNGSYRNLQDMKRVLDDAAKWFRSLDEKRL